MWKIWISIIATCWVTSAAAQGWSNDRIAEMLVRELSPTGAMESGQWFVSNEKLTPGVHGLGVIYAHIPGSAGSVSIHVGLFSWTGAGWEKRLDVAGVFGLAPKDAAFFQTHVEISTLTLGPNEPRCCPTVIARWSIDYARGQAVRVP
ncbi:MAG: hypothetical protein AAF665_11260 [Pseudomonadota bacterium]